MQNNSINRYGKPNATRGYFGGRSHSLRRLVKHKQLKSQWRRKRKAEIVSVSVLSKLLSLDTLPCPQIWNIEQETDREKEKVGDRPAKLKGDRDLERELKNKGYIFSLEEQHETFVEAVKKWEMLAATNAKWKWAAVKKSERENLRHFLHKKCN